MDSEGNRAAEKSSRDIETLGKGRGGGGVRAREEGSLT